MARLMRSEQGTGVVIPARRRQNVRCPGGLLIVRPSLVVALLVLATSSPGPVRADAVVGTGTAASCTEAELDAALGAGGNVTFNCGASPVTLTVTNKKTITLETSIDGGGVVTLSGGGSRQIFRVNSPGVLGLRNLTLTDSKGVGAVFNSGTLTVTNCTFADNNARLVGGGAIFNYGGTLTVTNSAFSGNSGRGAIFNTGTLTVTNSTFSNNSADYGGAIFNADTLAVSNSTFFSNDANFGGGAIDNGDAATLNVINSTFSSNTAPDGGAITNTTGTATVSNTIVADNAVQNCSGVITDGGHNLDDGASCGFSAANGSLTSTDPLLDPAGPQDSGGPTQTIMLFAGSPAIDAGDDAICAATPVKNLDQRGFVRPGVGHTHCSIGAYEADGAPPTACTGDCDRSRTVTVDELLTLVNIALGNGNVSDCVAGDANHDNQITIDEILTAVSNILNGCAA